LGRTCHMAWADNERNGDFAEAQRSSPPARGRYPERRSAEHPPREPPSHACGVFSMSGAVSDVAVEQSRQEAAQADFQYLEGGCRDWVGKTVGTHMPRRPLAEVLSNGVLLGRIGAIMQAKKDPKAPPPKLAELNIQEIVKERGYRAYGDMEVFLNQAKDVGINDIDRFVPADLVEQKDLLRVYRCIRRVAQAVSAQLGMPRFMSREEEIEARKRMMSTTRTAGMAGEYGNEEKWKNNSPEKWNADNMPGKSRGWSPSQGKGASSWKQAEDGKWINEFGESRDEPPPQGLLGKVGGAVVAAGKVVGAAAGAYGLWYILYDRFGPRHYTVRHGDCLTDVVYKLIGERRARNRTEREIDRIVMRNPQIFDPDLIYPRQKIKVSRRVLGM